MMRVISISIVLFACAGCYSTPLREDEITDPALVTIHAKFAEVVQAAREDPDLQWHSSWTGNMFVNHLGGKNRGLCHEWQRWVYDGVKPTVQEVGWYAVGIGIDRGNTLEHHAVIVYDPRKITQDQLLPVPIPNTAFVLDGWVRGQADIVRLEDWIDPPMRYTKPPVLEWLDAPKKQTTTSSE